MPDQKSASAAAPPESGWNAEILLPDQFSQTAEDKLDRMPEIRLLRAILKDAVDNILKYCSGKKKLEKRLFEEAYAWIFSDNQNYLITFVVICHILKLDVSYIRIGIKEALLTKGFDIP